MEYLKNKLVDTDIVTLLLTNCIHSKNNNYNLYQFITMVSGKASDYGISELEYKIICDQIARRKECREVFLKARTDPCLHSKEAGFVFDPAIQKFLSMKDTQLERFHFNFSTIRFGTCTILLPMFAMGYAMWKTRTELEWKYRCGVIRYKDRSFKLR